MCTIFVFRRISNVDRRERKILRDFSTSRFAQIRISVRGFFSRCATFVSKSIRWNHRLARLNGIISLGSAAKGERAREPPSDRCMRYCSRAIRKSITYPPPGYCAIATSRSGARRGRGRNGKIICTLRRWRRNTIISDSASSANSARENRVAPIDGSFSSNL